MQIKGQSVPNTMVVIAGIPHEIVIQNNKLNSVREKEKSFMNRVQDKIHRKNVKSQYSGDHSFISLEEDVNASQDLMRKAQSLSRQNDLIKLSTVSDNLN